MSKNKKKQIAEPTVKRTEKKAKERTVISPTLTMHEKIADLFVISMFTVFPIYMTNKLFNVRTDRLHYFIVTTFVLLFFLLATYLCGIDKEYWPKNLFKMSVSDWAFISFVVVCLISACLSEYGEEACAAFGL